MHVAKLRSPTIEMGSIFLVDISPYFGSWPVEEIYRTLQLKGCFGKNTNTKKSEIPNPKDSQIPTSPKSQIAKKNKVPHLPNSKPQNLHIYKLPITRTDGCYVTTIPQYMIPVYPGRWG